MHVYRAGNLWRQSRRHYRSTRGHPHLGSHGEAKQATVSLTSAIVSHTAAVASAGFAAGFAPVAAFAAAAAAFAAAVGAAFATAALVAA